MNFLFIHQNLPGQYRHIIPALANSDANNVVGVGEKKNIRVENFANFRVAPYETPKGASDATHHYLRGLEANVRRAQQVARTLMALKKKGFSPDIICGHHGWGELFFVKDVFPDAKLLSYLEFYYNPKGADVGFDPEFPATLDDNLRIRTRNAAILLTLEAADWGMSPTRWQRSQFPDVYRPQISAIHDGINTSVLKPDPEARMRLKTTDNRTVEFSREDEVITFVNRNLEPYRGFHTFMRALPEIQARRPNAHCVIVGGDGVSYGRAPTEGTYRQQMLKEVGERLDLSRVHFVGRIDYPDFIKMLQASQCHVYLTYPFVLSWSFLEAMSCECHIVASNTPPVAEIMQDKQTGLLTSFFDPSQLAERVVYALANPAEMKEYARRARRLIVEQYDLKTVCLPQQIRLLEDLLNGRCLNEADARQL